MTTLLTTKLGRPCAGVIAEADPTPFSSPCGVKKEKQTNVRHTDLFLRANLGTAALFVFGGDTNEPDTVSHTTTAAFNPWYAEANVDLGGALG